MHKKYLVLKDTSGAELSRHVADGWTIIHQEFVPHFGKVDAGKSAVALCVLLEREVEVPQASATATVAKETPPTPDDHPAKPLTPIEKFVQEELNTDMFEETIVEFDDPSPTAPPPILPDDHTVLPIEFTTFTAPPSEDRPLKHIPEKLDMLMQRLQEFDDIPDDVNMWQIPRADLRKHFWNRRDYVAIVSWIEDRDLYRIANPSAFVH